MYWLDRNKVEVMAGRVYVELGRPLRAVPLLTRAIAAYPADQYVTHHYGKHKPGRAQPFVGVA